MMSASMHTNGQQTFTITDSLPANYEGLKAAYSITDASEKEVGKKGNFSRYKIKFSITNTSAEAKLFLQKQGFMNGGSASDKIAQFRCENATGARFTNKEATLMMQPCKIEASVDDKECGTDKVNQNRRLVDIGYWIKAGESVIASSVMIVPLDEKPKMTVIFYPGNNGIVANTTYSNGNNFNSSQNSSQGIVRIKAFANNSYLNIQQGPLSCNGIDMQWWSAQWELLQVNGTGNFQIRNRWKNVFISIENSNLLSENGQSLNAMWIIEETAVSNTYFIKNAANSSKLMFQNGVLKSSSSYTVDASAQWILEK